MSIKNFWLNKDISVVDTLSNEVSSIPHDISHEISQLTVSVEKITNLAISMAGNILFALLIFFVGKWLVNKIVAFSKVLMGRSRMDPTVASFLSNLLYGVLLVIVVLTSLNKLGVNTTSFVAVLGGAAVAVGISLKDQLSNFAAGVMIIIFRPFNRGDNVEINGKTGIVQEITLINTRLVTLNNHEIIIPNSDFTTNALTNYSMRPTRRVDVVVGIGYGADIKTAKDIILRVAKQNPRALAAPEPLVRVTNLGDNAVDLTLNVWSENEDWYHLHCEMLESIKYAFDEQGIDIPFPQRTLHLENLDKLLDKKS